MLTEKHFTQLNQIVRKQRPRLTKAQQKLYDYMNETSRSCYVAPSVKFAMLPNGAINPQYRTVKALIDKGYAHQADFPNAHYSTQRLKFFSVIALK